jgi:electron transport complex protein RnfE
MKYIKILMNGLIKENPTFVLLLGMCPTLATTTSAINGLSMGLATMFVLICSNFAISCIKDVTPDKVRIPVFCNPLVLIHIEHLLGSAVEMPRITVT